MRRKLRRMAVYVALVCGLLGLCAYIARDPVRDGLGRIASAWLSRRLNGTLEIGALRGSLLSSLVLRDVVLRDRAGMEVVHLDEVRLEYDLATLLTKRLVVQDVHFVHPRATLVQDPEGQWNLSRVLSPGAPAGPPPGPERAAGRGFPIALVVEHVQIQDGHIALHTAALPGVQHLTGLQAHLQGQVDGREFRFQVHQLSVRTTPAEVVLQTAQGTLEGNAATIRLTDLRLQTAQTLMTADGTLPGGSQPASLALQLQPFDMAELGRLLQREDMAGPVHLTLTAQGPPEALAVHGQLSAEDSRLALHGQLNTRATPWRYRSSLELTHMNLATLLHQAPLQSDLNLQAHIEGEGLTPGTWRGEVRLDVQTSHVGSIALYPSRLQLAMQPGRFEVQQCDLQTSVARLTAAGLLDLASSSALRYDLTADLVGLRALIGPEGLEGTLRLRGQVSGALTAITLQGTLAGQHLRYGDAQVEAVQLTYEGAQLGAQPRVMAHLETHKARLGKVPVEHLTLDATYDSTVQQLQMTAEVAQSSGYSGKGRGSIHWTASSQQLTLDELVVHLAGHPWRTGAPVEVIRDGQGLRLTQLHLAHADEALELTGAFDGTRFQDVHLHATQIDVTFLRRLLSLPDFVQGRAALQAHLSGTLTAPVLALELTLGPEPQSQRLFDQLHATLDYAQQQLQSEIRVRQANREVLTVAARLPLELALTPLEMEQRLLASPVALHVHLQQPDLAALSRWQPALPNLTGTLQGDLKVQGTYANLDLDADVRLQQWGLQGRIEQVSAPISLQATFGLLPPGTDTAQAGWHHRLLPRIQKATLRVPTLRGQLPGPHQPLRSLQVQDLLVQVAGQWGPEGFDGTLERLQAQIGVTGWPRAEVRLAGRLTPQRLDLARLHVRLPQSEISGSGSLTLPHRQVQLRLDMPRLRLDEVGFSPPAPWPRLVQGVIDVRGSVVAPQVEAHLQYAEAQLDLDLTAQLEASVPRYSAALRLDHLKMAHVLDGEPGTLRAQFQIQGTGFAASQRRAEAVLRLETSGLTLAPGLTARVQASLTDSTVRFEDVQVRSAPVVVVARGTLSPTAPTALTYDVTLGDLTPLQRYIGVPVQAKGQFNGTVQGTWPALQARSRLQLREWAYGGLQGQRVQADLAVSQFPTASRATINVQVVDVQGPALPRSAATLAGTYTPSQGTVQVQVTAGPYQKSGFEGRITLAQEQRLTLTRFRLQHQDFAWENTDPLTVVRSSKGQLDLQRLELRNGRQEISARGILKPGGGIEADLHVRHLQLLPPVQMVAPHAGVVDGEGTLHLSLRGTLAQLQGEGDLHLTSLRWQQHDVGEVHGQVQIKGTVVRVDLRWRDQKQELLHLAGEASLDTHQALTLQLQAANVDLQGLKAFIPAVMQSAGTLHLDLRLTGTLQHPQVYGALRVNDGVLQLATTGVRYKDIQMQLVCTGNRIEFTQVHAQSGEGTLDLTGDAESAGLSLRRLNLDLQMQQFTLMHTPALEAVVSAAVALRGSLDDVLATGTVTVSPARVQVSGKLVGGPDIVQPWQLTVDGVYGSGPRKATTDAVESVARPRSPLPFLRADLQLELPRNVWVRSPGTAIELSGALTITKELGEPFVLGGTVETVRGFASFYSGKFSVDQGRVTFTGTPEINPVLDVTVTRAVSGYTVSIHVSGRAKSPQLHLSSTPDLPQADIVTLLVVGKTTDRLTASERSGLSSHAQQIVGNVAAGELEQLLAKPLGFDTLDVQTGDKLGSSKVSVGRYITQDIFLSYEQPLGDEKGNKVGVEYSINRYLKVKGSGSNTGDSALDILWRIDY
jgi:autotransporter translocation and assembly factor TamB